MKTSISSFLTQRSHASHTSLGLRTSLIRNLRRCSAIDLYLLQCMPNSQKAWIAYKEEIKARIDFTNAEFAKMLPRTATWCKTPQVKPKPRASTNPAPECLSFQNNILYFNGQPVGKGVFSDVLPSEGSEVTISGSDERILKSH